MKNFSLFAPCACLTLAWLASCTDDAQPASDTLAGGAGGGSSAPIGGTNGAIGSGGEPSSGGKGGTGSGVVDLSQLHSACVDGACPPPLAAVKYYGIAGTAGPEFCSCEIRCSTVGGGCPSGTSCTTIYDGPGTVCVESS